MIKCMCGYEKEAGACHVEKLTPQEKKDFLDAGHTDIQDQYYYCQPCWRLLQNPETAATFMRNSYEQRLRALGVPNARKLADQYHTKLIELRRKATHATQT